jgi:anti-sigma regulatory factor (Ser/Thr protein kinase)
MSPHRSTAPRFVLSLPSDPRAVPIARGFVHVLDPWTDPERIDDVELIVSELVTNAVRHGNSSISQCVELEMTAEPSGVAGSVKDEGRAAFGLSNALPAGDRPGGFGLFIARTLADTLEVESSPSGHTVRFTLAARDRS